MFTAGIFDKDGTLLEVIDLEESEEGEEQPQIDSEIKAKIKRVDKREEMTCKLKLGYTKEEALRHCLSGFHGANSFMKEHPSYPSPKIEQLRKSFYRAVRILKPEHKLRH